MLVHKLRDRLSNADALERLAQLGIKEPLWRARSKRVLDLRGRVDELLSISAAEISIDNCNKSFQTLVRARNVLVGANEVLFGANLRID